MAEHSEAGRMVIEGRAKGAHLSPNLLAWKGATMKLMGECVLVRDADGWTATFPQFNDVATSGRTREEAIRNAREVLELEAIDLMEDNARAPRLAHVAEVVLLDVDVSKDDAERAHYITKAQAAERLEVSKPRVSALIASGQLEVKRFDNKELVSIASVSEYEATPRKSGRPQKIAM